MSEVQIAIIDQEDTQITLAVPGVQGPAGAISSGGSANQVFYKVSNTNYDAGWIFIGNANVDAAAAIAGTKISPNFGSQAILTTGTNTAASFNPTSNTAPTNGVYLPAANSVAISTNGTGRLFVDSLGRVTVTAAASPGLTVNSAIALTGVGTSELTTSDASGLYLTSNASVFYLQGNNEFIFRGAAASSYAERMRITSAGLVGIGTSSPGTTLSVSAAPDTVGATNGANFSILNPGLTVNQINSTTIGMGFGGIIGNFAGDLHLRSFWGFSIDKGAGNLGSGAANSVNADSRTFAIRQFAGGTTWNTQFCVNGSGNVGIGTTGPAGELDVRGLNSGNLYVGRTNNTGSGSEPGSINLSGPNASGTARVWGRINSIIDTATEGSEASNLAFLIQKAGNLSEAARLDSSGRLLVGTATQVGNVNGGILQLGSGITFPATPVATTDVNTLDDYEEGTWTPVYVATTGTLGAITYDNVQGTYVKVGRLVTITGGLYCLAFAVGTGSGQLRIGGLPFTGANVSNAISVGDSRLFTSNNPTGGVVSSNVSFFYRTTANGEINNLQVSDAATGSGALNLIYFTASYQI